MIMMMMPNGTNNFIGTTKKLKIKEKLKLIIKRKNKSLSRNAISFPSLSIYLKLTLLKNYSKSVCLFSFFIKNKYTCFRIKKQRINLLIVTYSLLA